MQAVSRGTQVQVAGHLFVVLLLLALLETPAPASDIVGLGAELPVLEFDVPSSIVCVDVTPPEYRPASPGDRLLRVAMPVSVVVLRGEPHRVQEVIFEIDGAEAGLTVFDFAPDTTLSSDRVSEVKVQRTEEDRNGIDASLGGALPAAGGTIHLTPSITAGKSNRTTQTTTETRLPPKKAVLVSGAVNRRQGVYFKLRNSSQTTLEGEHQLSITFVAPADWESGKLNVQCVGRGQKKWLFIKQRKVWNVTKAPVQLSLAKHHVAKPVCDCKRGALSTAVEEPAVTAQGKPDTSAKDSATPSTEDLGAKKAGANRPASKDSQHG